MRGVEQNPNVSSRYDERAMQYQILMSHGFRDLYHTINAERGIENWDDEKIARNPQTVRAVMRDITRIADEWWQEMKACYEVSDEYLDDFVRARTQPQWRKLMEESGMEWSTTDAKGGRWVPKKSV